MTEPDWTMECELCGRRRVVHGFTFRVEGAFDREGASPAIAFIEELRTSESRDERDIAATLAVRFRELAATGILRIPMQLNDLGHGISELKAGDVRIPFYESICGGKRTARLTHGFRKRGQKTPPREIRIATAIREEDRKR